MARLLDTLRTLARRHGALALVVLTSLGVTIASWRYVSDVADMQSHARFDGVVANTVTAVQNRMEAYVAALRATRGMFLDGREPGRRAFREFTASLEMPRQYPGIQGIGFAKLVAARDLQQHEQAVREEGFPGYRVWPTEPRDVYTTILYLEPFDWRNQRAFGYDMFSEPVRREAMARARDTGEAAASGKVELVQEAGRERQAGFLMYLPVYAHPVSTVAERREALVGWVYAPFRAGDLLRGTLDEAASRVVDIEVFDGPAPSAAALLFDGDASNAIARNAPGGLGRVEQVEIGGRTWTLQFAARTSFLQVWELWLPRFVLLLGLLITGFLFWVTRAEARALVAAEGARERAAFLAEAGKVLGSSLDYARNIDSVARLATSRVADGCVVFVQEAVGSPLFVVSHRDEDVAARAREKLAQAWVDPEEQVGVSAVLRTGRPEVLNDLGAQVPFLASNEDLLALQRDSGTAHALTIPLFARGEPLGALTLTSSHRSRRFGQAEVALGEDLARLLVAAIDAGRLYRRAQESLRLRDEFLSIASHELKTPLTSLTLQSESLRAGAASATPESVTRKADAIRRNVDRLSRLVATLLDLSRITAGRLEIHREDVDLVEVVTDVMSRFEDEARRAGCDVRLEAPVPVVGEWDRLRLDQVVTNLLANAVKYGPGKPVDIRVEKRLDSARLTIRDRGIGISDADQKRIFERFERAVSDRNYGGFGLGLWIVRRIVEAMGGAIHVESEPGQGATFVVELRRGAADDVRDLGKAAPRSASADVGDRVDAAKRA